MRTASIALTTLALTVTAHAQDGPPWEAMDYGPFLSASIEVARGDIACKGIAIPLGGPNGEAMLFDTDLLRWACGWRGDFVELRGIVYDGPHGTFPRIAGEPDWRNGPRRGVSRDGSFEDTRDVPFGPIDAMHGRWSGLSTDGHRVGVSYRAGALPISERPSLVQRGELVGYGRHVQYRGWPNGAGPNAYLAVCDMPPGDRVTVVERARNDDDALLVIEHAGRPTLAIGLVTRDGSQRLEHDANGVRLFLNAEEPGLGTCELLLVPVEDDDDVEACLALLAEHEVDDGRPFHRDGVARWAEQPTLQGRLDITFDGGGDDAERIVRRPGDIEALHVLADHRSKGSLMTFDGAIVEPVSIDAGRAIMVIEPPADDAPDPRASWSFDEGEGARMLDAVSGERSLRLDGVTWRRGVRGRSIDFDGTARAVWEGGDLDPTTQDFTVAAWIHTSKDGTIASRTRPEGPWVRMGWTFFVRGGRLAFDVGWVGAVEGEREIADAAWHHVACTYRHEDGRVELYVDGALDGEGELEVDGPVRDAVVQLGFTAGNFPGETWFSGYMDGVRIFDGILDEEAIRAVASDSGEPIVTAWGVRGELPGARFVNGAREKTLVIPPPEVEMSAELVCWSGLRSDLDSFLASLDPLNVVDRPFAIDEITWPDDNPYHSWMRFGGFDFDADGRDALITTWSGDVWRVSGLDADLDALVWQRIATGLNQPFGVVKRGNAFFVLGRDQITQITDTDDDGEIEAYACTSNLLMNSEHFHEPCTGLQIGPDGWFWYVKAARHAKVAAHPQNGTLIRVSPTGDALEILASGFRAPCGLWVDPDGTAFCSDQEGHWMPANRINVIEKGGFYGNNWTGTGAPRDEYDPPLCWIHPTVDRSPSAQVRVTSSSWDGLDGALLGLSYGTGEVYLLLEDEVDGVKQGGVVKLPIQLPTGLMCGRFNPADGHLYVCGLFGWSSNQTQPGGFYRIRATGDTPMIVRHVRATTEGLRVRFSRPIDIDESRFRIQAWNYEWSERYGSPEFKLDGSGNGRTRWNVTEVRRIDDRTVMLVIPEIEPAMQVHVEYDARGTDGEVAESYAHLSVHRLAETD